MWHGGAELRYGDEPAPEVGAGAVPFRVTLAGVCGSDLHPYRGHHGPRTPPLVLGHEAVGRVDGDTDMPITPHYQRVPRGSESCVETREGFQRGDRRPHEKRQQRDTVRL